VEGRRVTSRIDPTDWGARNRRLDALLASVDKILAKAERKFITDFRDGKNRGRTKTATVTMFSGGNDSIVLAHLMRTRTDYFGHANTGIGVEATREFVRKTCAEWGVPLLERHPPAGSTYEDRVLTQGFPGPADHGRTFNRIKGRAFEQINKELVPRPHSQRVIFVAGRRYTESERRRQRKIPVWEHRKSIVWVSPLRGWTDLDLLTYRRRFPDCPRNEVADTLHMSGECLCGCMAQRGELDYLSTWLVAADAVAQIRQLEREVSAVAAERGIPAERCRWGWGAYRDRRKQPASNAKPLFELDAVPNLCAADCGMRKFSWDDTARAAA
jgi:3'-phosphoadenosine 5'-phosphosulfate sulfotransferase (PAPS reductase)/FAD synthetase